MASLIDNVLNRLTLRQLRLVAAVARFGSIQRAADESGLTQPTVTKAVQEVESILGVSLFERTNRGVIPTCYTEILVRRSRLVFAQLRDAGEEIRELKDGSGGRIIVGSLFGAAARILPEAILRVKESRPRVSVTILEGTTDLLMPELRDGNVDFVIRRPPWPASSKDRQGIVEETLYSEIACFVVRPQHPLTKKRKPTRRDLLDFDWVMPRPETALRGQIEQSFTDEGLPPPRFAVDSISLPTNFYLVSHADFVSVWTYQGVRPFLQSGQLSILRIVNCNTIGPVVVSRRPEDDELSSASKALLGHVREVGKLLRDEEAEWRSIYRL